MSDALTTDPMDPATLEALRGSIAKWEGIVAGTLGDRGTENCPLCKLFWRDIDEHDDACVGCPVFAKTGNTDCGGTPFWKWIDSHEFPGLYPLRAETDKQREAAREELDFLKSLLPKEAP